MNDYSYLELSVGMTESFSVTIEESMMDMFRSITKDDNPLHVDKEFASKHDFADKVVYGLLTSSFLSTLAGVYLPGKCSLIQGVDVKYVQPVFVGDTLSICGEIVELHDSVQQILLKVEVRNQHGVKVVRGKMKIGILS